MCFLWLAFFRHPPGKEGTSDLFFRGLGHFFPLDGKTQELGVMGRRGAGGLGTLKRYPQGTPPEGTAT